MNPPLKRFRQTSLFESWESFARNKKPKDLNMTDASEMRNVVLAATEKRLSSQSTSDASANTKSVQSKIFSSKFDAAISATSSKMCKGKTESNETDVTNIFAECSKAFEEIAVVSENESAFETSADLFPDENESPELLQSSAELFTDEMDSEPQPTETDDGVVESAEQDDDDSDDDESEEQAQARILNRSPACCLPLPKLEPKENHSIMFSPHIRPGDAPRPYPPSYRDRWDFDYVRMPCSPQNKFPLESASGEKYIVSRWQLICESLTNDIGSSQELEDAIMKYNSQYIGRWNFHGLHALLNQHFSEAEREHFFETVLPFMIQMALDLPSICTQPPPLLKKGRNRYVTMTQKQIGCLLLNAFFCTFPRRTPPHRKSSTRFNFEYASYPDINFNRLFYGTKNKISSRNAEKLKCLLNYFKRITTTDPTGTVTFHRQCLRNSDMPSWSKSTRGIRTAVIQSSGLIETDGIGMLQVDFANKFVGGGVLGQGCVQEEIRFIICPELIVSRLIVECLGPNEVLIVTGVEQYNKYSGYGDDFKWEGDFRDVTPRDSWGRRYTQLVAMDATHFRNTEDQLKTDAIRRELNKAYCGFYKNGSPSNHTAIATGNWGCGAFRGNPKLKFLIQLMAASEAGRNMMYFTFGNKKLKKELKSVFQLLTDKNLSVGDVWRLLIEFSENVSVFSRKAKYSDLYDFIHDQFLTQEGNCRQEETEMVPSLDDSDKRAMEKLIEDIAADNPSSEYEEVACDDASTEIEDNNCETSLKEEHVS